MLSLSLSLSLYIYIYIYMHTHKFFLYLVHMEASLCMNSLLMLYANGITTHLCARTCIVFCIPVAMNTYFILK